MRVLGLPIETPQSVINRILGDVGAIARAARTAPAQLDRMLALGEEIVAIGRGVLEIAERLDRRAEAIMTLGEQLDDRAQELLEVGGAMRDLGGQIEERGTELVDRGADIIDRGGEIADRATRVVETGNELIAVLPALERALEMATPLEGAIDRFGRLVDRLPGGGPVRRRADRADPPAPSPEHEQTPEHEPS
ncbi:MAG: hypothetical protein JOZ73_13435 [Solirubrobacterales bacterium]|nr:hypothetical protein [Solirubrobacterales bacterium]